MDPQAQAMLQALQGPGGGTGGAPPQDPRMQGQGGCSSAEIDKILMQILGPQMAQGAQQAGGQMGMPPGAVPPVAPEMPPAMPPPMPMP